MVGDGICQKQCNTYACGFDSGDCCSEDRGDEGGGEEEECLQVNVGIWIGAYGREVGWEIPGTCPPMYGVVGEYGRVGWYNKTGCIPHGVHVLKGYDSVGDGWDESFIVIEEVEGGGVVGERN